MKNVLIFSALILLSTTLVVAQKGLFLRFSLGPGFTTETSSINNSGLAIAAKNHAIGWGINEKFTIYIGEFGSLNKISTGTYNYINTDAFGLGLAYRTPQNFKFSLAGGYSWVSLSTSWKEQGDWSGEGYGINMSVFKEWYFAKRFGFGVGPQAYLIRTTDMEYLFLNFSLNFSLSFYLTPVSQISSGEL